MGKSINQVNRKNTLKIRLWKKRICMLGLLFIVSIMVFSATVSGQVFWRAVNGGNDLNGITAQMNESPLTVYFLDVGKADAILVSCEGQNILIDTGTYADGDTVEIWLKKLGIINLDTVFVTHPDSDHIGGAAHILETFQVEQFVVSDIPGILITATDEYKAMMSSLDNNSIPMVTAKAGDEFTYEACTFEILGPVGDHTGVNNYSLVQKLQYKDVSILFCGDMEKRAEQFMCDASIDLKADVLKVAHHGSRTSSSQTFLEAVDADYAIISTGLDRNNLPNNDVLQRLEDCGMEVYRTDLDGTVVLYTDGYEIKFASSF